MVILKYDATIIKSRLFYVYLNHLYASKGDMIEAIREQFGAEKLRHIRLVYYPKKSKGLKGELKNYRPILETIHINSIRKEEKKNYEIKKVYNCSGSVCYQCGNKLFPTYESAARYLKIKQSKLQFTDEKVQEFKKEEPPNRINVNKNIVTNPHKDAEKMREELEKKYIPNVLINGVRFSNSIWNEVWSGYTYDVYSKHNFFILKQKFLKEINMYRKLHKVKPLIEDGELEHTAQWCANKYLTSKRPEFDVGENSNVLVGIVRYLDSPIMVKFWYDEGFFFSFNKPNGTAKTEHFSQLMWKDTRRIGMGVARKRENMYIIFIFNPKGNIPNKYKKNVFPRKIKR